MDEYNIDIANAGGEGLGTAKNSYYPTPRHSKAATPFKDYDLDIANAKGEGFGTARFHHPLPQSSAQLRRPAPQGPQNAVGG